MQHVLQPVVLATEFDLSADKSCNRSCCTCVGCAQLMHPYLLLLQLLSADEACYCSIRMLIIRMFRSRGASPGLRCLQVYRDATINLDRVMQPLTRTQSACCLYDMHHAVLHLPCDVSQVVPRKFSGSADIVPLDFRQVVSAGTMRRGVSQMHCFVH